MKRMVVFCIGLTSAGCLVKTNDEAASTKKPPASSCSIDTKAMRLSMSAQADGPTTKLFAGVLSNGSVALDCGDTFAVTFGGRRVVLEREAETTGDVVHYVGELPSGPTATTFTFALERQPPRTSAPASHAYLPADFRVVDPSTSVRVSANDKIAFRVDPPLPTQVASLEPSTVRLRIDVEGTCLDKNGNSFMWQPPNAILGPVADAEGHVSVDTKYLKRKVGEGACEATVKVTELTPGDVDPAFAGGVSGSFDAEGSRHAPPFTMHVDW